MEGNKKKAKLRTSEDVFNRLKWDKSIDPSNFVIGYLDRFDGLQEIALNEFVTTDSGGDIPFHRIYYFRDGDEIVWDRRTRFDKVFGSGDVATADEEEEEEDAGGGESNNSEGVVGVEGVHEIHVFGPESEVAPELKSNSHVIDITPTSADPRWVRFSALYPHGKIPVPKTKSVFSQTLEGVWQALKVFENEGIDQVKLKVKTMKGLDRQSNNKRGKFRGFSQGVPKARGKSQNLATPELWSEHEARAKIWLPSYRWVLENCLKDEVAELRKLALEKPLVIIDAFANQDVDDLSERFGVASILKSHLLGARLTAATATTEALPQRQRHQRTRATQQQETNSKEQTQKKESTSTNAKEQRTEGDMPEVKSCGMLIFCELNGDKYFLLMKHATRWDLPKGHVDGDETDLETAYREMEEETGIKRTQVEVDPKFHFFDIYYPTYRRRGGTRVKKTLHIFLANIQPVDGGQGEKILPPISLTEHPGFQWLKWNPPHSIQENTINPLLKTADAYFTTGEVPHTGENGDEEEEEEEAEEAEEQAVGSSGASDKETGKRRQKKQQKALFEKNKANVVQEKGKPVSKARRKRNQRLEGGGYAVLEKCHADGEKGQVGICDENITFSEKALDTQAKLMLKRNYKNNVRLDPSVHAYEGENDEDEDEEEGEEDREIREMYTKPQGNRSAGLAEYLSAGQDLEVEGPEWACGACTLLNKSGHLACSVCATPRPSPTSS